MKIPIDDSFRGILRSKLTKYGGDVLIGIIKSVAVEAENQYSTEKFHFFNHYSKIVNIPGSLLKITVERGNSGEWSLTDIEITPKTREVESLIQIKC